MKILIQSLMSAATLALFASTAIAGPNDFFGTTLPGGPPGSDAAAQAAANAQAGGGDYTADEKRMQKKYKASVQRAHQLVAKGESMMKRGESSNNDKLFKKGKIFKEIGEKQLSELKANNPFPEAQGKVSKKQGGQGM